MPFFLSLKPQETNINLPKHEFNKMHEAEAAADQLLKDCPGLLFVGVFFADDNTPPRLITNLVQKGFRLYSWTQFKYFDRFNKIAAYFVLNGDHYIKLKKTCN